VSTAARCKKKFNYFFYSFNIKAKGHEGHLHCSTQYKFKQQYTVAEKAIYYRVTIAKMFDTTKM